MLGCRPAARDLCSARSPFVRVPAHAHRCTHTLCLHCSTYGARGHPVKMTGSRFAFSSRNPQSRAQKIRRGRYLCDACALSCTSYGCATSICLSRALSRRLCAWSTVLRCERVLHARSASDLHSRGAAPGHGRASPPPSAANGGSGGAPHRSGKRAHATEASRVAPACMSVGMDTLQCMAVCIAVCGRSGRAAHAFCGSCLNTKPLPIFGGFIVDTEALAYHSVRIA